MLLIETVECSRACTNSDTRMQKKADELRNVQICAAPRLYCCAPCSSEWSIRETVVQEVNLDLFVRWHKLQERTEQVCTQDSGCIQATTGKSLVKFKWNMKWKHSAA